jgi:hypothetical protein
VIFRIEDFMDKMTDAKIRLWLEKKRPDLLATYKRYQTERLGEFPLPGEEAPAGPEPLRIWLENRHPEILEQIFHG